jgi:hypothetical protein
MFLLIASILTGVSIFASVTITVRCLEYDASTASTGETLVAFKWWLVALVVTWMVVACAWYLAVKETDAMSEEEAGRYECPSGYVLTYEHRRPMRYMCTANVLPTIKEVP